MHSLGQNFNRQLQSEQRTFLLLIFFFFLKQTIKISPAYGDHLSLAWEPIKTLSKVPKEGKSVMKVRHKGRRMYNLLLFYIINKEAGCGEADFWS